MHYKSKKPLLPSKKRLFNLIMPSIFFALCSVDALAATTSWIAGPASANWNSSFSWDNNVPTSSDTANINNNGIASISGIAATAQSIGLGGASGTGTINISSGGTLTYTSLDIGKNGGNGTVNITGSNMVASAATNIGNNAIGTLTASNFAEISTPGSTGSTETIIGLSGGTGSVFLKSNATLWTRRVRFSSSGSLNFDGGILKEKFEDTADFILKSAGATYNLIIDGGGATIDSYGFDIGTDLAFSGSGGLTKAGSGTFTLRGDNIYEGGTTILGGTLQLGNNTATGTITGNIVNNAALVFDLTGTPSYAGDISSTTSGTVENQGAGSLTLSGAIKNVLAFTQSGTGKTILTGTNTYTGGTTISGGTLQLGNNTATGTITGNIVNNAALVFDLTGTQSYAGNVSTTLGGTVENKGSGTLTLSGAITTSLAFSQYFTQSGTGKTILTGTNTYTGGTTISGGTLQLGNNTSTGTISTFSIVDDAALVFDLTGTQSYAGNIGSTTSGTVKNQGAGSLTLSGAITDALAFTQSGNGTTILTGTNTYTDGTTISAGTLNLGGGGSTGSVTGNIAIASGANLTFDRNNDVEYSGILSGTGTLTKLNGAELTLIGDSPSYTGLTTISDGTLRLGNGGATGNVGGDIENNNTLIFDRSNDATYAGIISGSGTVTKEGDGTLTLLGINSYLGETMINAGGVKLGDAANSAATIAGDVLINSLGRLSGYGTILQDLTNNGGIVSPGASIGTLTVNGNYVQSSSGTYVVQVDQSGNSDLLQIGGTATLDGTVGISAINNGFLRNYPYTILTAAGGVSGTFSNTNIDGIFNQGFLQGVVSYLPTGSPTIVQFEVDYNPVLFEEAAITPNQKAVADYILLTGGTPGVQALISTLTTDAEFQAAMDQISGATYANQTMAIAHVGSGFERELANRFMAFPSASDPRCVCPNGQLKYQNRNQAPGGWVSVYGGQDDIHSGQVSGLITNSEGIALGYEWPVNCQTKLGVGAGYTHFKGHATDRESASDNGNLLQVGLYGRYEKCGWLLGAAIDAGRTTDLSAERQVQGAMALFSPKSHYRANLLSEQVVASYDLLGSKRCWKLRPFVGFINQQVNSDGFTEEGNSGFELNVRSNDYHSARSQLGVLWEAPITQSVRPFASVDWEHEFADRNGSFDASLVGLTTPPTFHIVGQEIGRDSAGVKAGLNLVRQGRFNLAVLYQGQFASGWQQNGAALEAGFRFD